jgi:hypothetical protein
MSQRRCTVAPSQISTASSGGWSTPCSPCRRPPSNWPAAASARLGPRRKSSPRPSWRRRRRRCARDRTRSGGPGRQCDRRGARGTTILGAPNFVGNSTRYQAFCYTLYSQRGAAPAARAAPLGRERHAKKGGGPGRAGGARAWAPPPRPGGSKQIPGCARRQGGRGARSRSVGPEPAHRAPRAAAAGPGLCRAPRGRPAVRRGVGGRGSARRFTPGPA